MAVPLLHQKLSVMEVVNSVNKQVDERYIMEGYTCPKVIMRSDKYDRSPQFKIKNPYHPDKKQDFISQIISKEK